MIAEAIAEAIAHRSHGCESYGRTDGLTEIATTHRRDLSRRYAYARGPNFGGVKVP